MSVPKAVKDQADAANEHFSSANRQEPDPAQPPGQATEQNIDTPPPVPAATQESAIQALAEQPPAPPADPKTTDWELRFRNYKAATDKTIHQLRTENSAMQAEIEEMRRSAESDAQGNVQRGKATPLLTDEEREEYGDLADMIERVGQRIAEREIQPAVQRVDRMEREVREAARKQFEARLSEMVPDWRRVNVAPGFIEWLKEPDDDGEPRTHGIHSAAAQQDVQAVAAYFNRYKELAGGSPTRSRPDPSSRVMPETVRSGDSLPGDMPAGRLYTHAEVNALFKERTHGRYKEGRGRESEWRAIESDIIAAGKEGRIR